MKLYNKDCMGVMADMPDGSIDLIVTDPAYKTISGGKNSGLMANRPAGILKKNDGKIFTENNITPATYIPEFFRILKPESHLYLMTNFLNLETMMAELRKAGFQIHNLLIWQKNNVTPNRWYMKNVEYTIFARKGKAFAINNMGSKTCVLINNPPSPKLHETEKPVELMELYVGNSSQEGQVVLDPFMGAGATGIACKRLGRKFIGCELDPKHFETAQMRFLI